VSLLIHKVNQLLTDEIAQLHAFSQVGFELSTLIKRGMTLTVAEIFDARPVGEREEVDSRDHPSSSNMHCS
jgi:hypothetical protein